MSAAPPALDADLTAGLRRLKLATMRQLAPELLTTAKTQRWSPEEVLRALGPRLFRLTHLAVLSPAADLPGPDADALARLLTEA